MKQSDSSNNNQNTSSPIENPGAGYLNTPNSVVVFV